jgi:glutamyl-tRNA synthetase
MTPGRFPPRVRIAPSPTGAPHVGTAYVALFNRTFAKKHGGQFILRIEDTDRTRSTRESEDAIYRALRWLGLDWDEGPDVGGPCAPYRQSERSAIYADHARMLLDNGTAYRCFCTAERLDELRAFQRAAKRPPGYDGLCRKIPADESSRRATAGEAFVIRLRIPDDGATAFDDLLRGRIEIANKDVDDQVLMKSDGFPTYHLANVVDDKLMGITHVMRAEEWIPSTPKHLLLYRAFGWEPPVFCHLPLLRNQDKSKISKRKNPTSLEWYQEQGYLPAALLNFLALMGWTTNDNTEIFSVDRMLEEFAPETITTSSPVFDLTKLDWLNGEYIRALTTDALTDKLVAFYAERGRTLDRGLMLRIVPLVRERLKKLVEFDEMTQFFFTDAITIDLAEFDAAKKLTPEQRKQALTSALAVVRGTTPFTKDAMEVPMKSALEALGFKMGDFFMCLRVAITGKRATPPLLESMEVLGQDVCVRRIEAALRLLG